MIFFHWDYFRPQITQISRLYSPSNVFLAHGMHGTHGILLFISHRLHRLKWFLPFGFNDSLFCCAKIALRICTDFYLTAFFLDMKTREHDFLSRRLLFLTECTECTEFYLSPTDYTDNTDSFFFFFRCALWLRQMRSTDLHRLLPCAFVFLDMKTWEYDFFSRNSRFIVWMGIGRCDYAGCFIVYLSYIYSIFMVYL